MYTAKQFNNIITNQERLHLIEYLQTVDDRYDSRPDITSKHPIWNESDWPQHIIQNALDKIFPKGYEVCDVTFMDSKIGLKPHSDWIGGYKTVLFTLYADPVAHTVMFDNYVREKPNKNAFAVFLTKQKWSPFQYTLEDKNGSSVYVEDIRKLAEQCKTSPGTVQQFNVTDSFIEMLDALIIKRGMPQLNTKDQNDTTGYTQHTPRISDYSWVTNHKENTKFDKDIHNKYLKHIDIEDLHGLTFQEAIEWNIGSAIAFDSDQIHSASSTHSRKMFATIFLRSS